MKSNIKIGQKVRIVALDAYDEAHRPELKVGLEGVRVRDENSFIDDDNDNGCISVEVNGKIYAFMTDQLEVI